MVKTIVIWRDNLKQASQAVKLLFHYITVLLFVLKYVFLTRLGTTQVSRTISPL